MDLSVLLVKKIMCRYNRSEAASKAVHALPINGALLTMIYSPRYFGKFFSSFKSGV